MPRLILNFKEENNEKHSLIREIFTSLRHSTVLYYLIEGPKTPTVIAEEMGVSRTAITFTLNKLIELNLVEKNKKGKEVFYHANNNSAYNIVKDIIIKNMREKSPAINENIDYEKVEKLFERDDLKELLGICCTKVAREKRYPLIKVIDDFLNTVHVVYVNAALNKTVNELDAREALIRMNKQLKGGLDELMKAYITHPASNYNENLEWFKRVLN